jgi:hypothetical protein
MRLKKNNKTEEIIEVVKTFDNIPARDLGAESLKDGDSVKVLDASDDPKIQSGWAIYRFCFETKSFDLIEKEEVEKIEMLEPDYITTTLGAGKYDRSLETIVTPMAMGAISKTVQFLEEFDFTLRIDNNNASYSKIYFTPTGLTDGELRRFVPINTKEGLKYLVIEEGKVYIKKSTFTGSFQHFGILMKVVDDKEAVIVGSVVQSETFPDGKCLNYDNEADGIGGGGLLPVMIIRGQRDVSGNFNYVQTNIFKLWKNNLVLSSPPEIKIDNKTIIENPAKELVSLHSLNQGIGFEFPEPTFLNVDFSDPTFMKIHWLNHNTGVDVFKYKNIEYKLGLRDHTYSAAGVQTNCDTLGFTHYARISAFLGYTYWGARCELFSELPDLNPFVYSTKEYLPVAIVKLVFNPDYTLNLVETQISEIYKKGILVKEVQEAVTAEKWDLDKNTIFQTTLWEKEVLFSPSALQTHRANFTILEDFGLKFSTGETYTSKKTFLFVEPENGKRFIPVMLGGVKKYMNLIGEHVLMNDIFGASFAGQWKYFVLRAQITDTNTGVISNLSTTYENSGEAVNIGPYPNDGQYYFAQIGVKFNADGKTIDDMENIKVFPYWKQALNLGAIPTFDANTIDRSQVSEFSNQFSVPEAMHGFRQDQIVLKDFDFDFSHDKDTKLITMSVRGGGFKAIPILVGGVRKYIHLQECTFDMSEFGFGSNRFHFAVSAPVRDTAVYSTNGMTNQYNGENGGVANVKPSKFDNSVTLFQVSGTVPDFGTQLESHAFSVHKYWKKALAPFNDLYAEMMP